MSDKSRSIQQQDAYRRLRPMLLHGHIPAGTRLGEVEWAAKLGVHRGALRETFGLLVHEGLLVHGERGGHFVPRFEKADLDEIVELRAALEVAAVRRLSSLGKPVNVESLRAICRAMQEMAEIVMPLGFAEADRRFHEELVRLAGNQRVIHAYLHAPTFISVQHGLTEETLRKGMYYTLDDHENICKFLEKGHFEEAVSLLERHLFVIHSTRKSAPSWHKDD